MTEARLRGLPCKSSAAWTPPLTIHSCGHMQVVLIESWWLIDIYKQGPNEPKDNTSHLCTCVTDTCDQHLGKDSKGRAWAAFGNPTPTRPWELQTLMDPVLGIPWDPGERSFCEQGAVQLLQRQSPRELRTQHLVSEPCLASGPGSHLSGAGHNRRQSMCLVEKICILNLLCIYIL